MLSIPRALALSFGQLGDRAILRVLGKTLAITLALFIALGAALQYALAAGYARLFGAPDGGIASLLATLVLVVAAWLLFRVVALFVLQFFAEDVVRAVEARHYPAAATTVRKLSLGEEMHNALRALGRTLAVNALALPVAALLLFTAVGAPLVFALANAVLIGRELQDMVWLRHRHDPAQPMPLRAPARLALGGLVVALLAIPFLNLLAPLLGAATATHLVHRAPRKTR